MSQAASLTWDCFRFAISTLERPGSPRVEKAKEMLLYFRQLLRVNAPRLGVDDIPPWRKFSTKTRMASRSAAAFDAMRASVSIERQTSRL